MNVNITVAVRQFSHLIAIGLCCLPLTSCSPNSNRDAQTRRGRPDGGNENRPVSVDVAIARQAQLQDAIAYTGTTLPYRVVTVRSQVEGQILNIAADVGQPITQGQNLVRVNDEILATTVLQAQAEVAARQADVARSQADVNDAQAQVQQAQLEAQQAQADAQRFEKLLREGAISQQQAESARTQARTAAERVKSAQQQVLNQKRAVEAAQRRVASQTALVTQAKKRQSFSVLKSPVTGVVVERLLEPGDLAQTGSEILRLADLSRIKVTMQVSDLAIQQVRLGQKATVRFDALPNQSFVGSVTQLSPAADPVARLFPVEVTIANPQSHLTSGLLARITFTPPKAAQVIIPEAALQVGQSRDRGGDAGKPVSSAAANLPAMPTEPPNANTIFVVTGTEKSGSISVRSVQLGDRANSQVEVLSGLESGERVVVRSSGRLTAGTLVQLSLISETSGGDRTRP